MDKEIVRVTEVCKVVVYEGSSWGNTASKSWFPPDVKVGDFFEITTAPNGEIISVKNA